MNIGQVHGHGGVERGGGRAVRADGRRGEIARPAGAADRAAISDGGRDAAVRFAERVDAVMADDPARAGLVAEAASRLRAGGLDQEAVLRAVAGRLLAGGFLTV